MPRKVIITVDSNEVYEPEDDVCRRRGGPRCTCCSPPQRLSVCEAVKKLTKQITGAKGKARFAILSTRPRRNIVFKRIKGVYCFVETIE